MSQVEIELDTTDNVESTDVFDAVPTAGSALSESSEPEETEFEENAVAKTASATSVNDELDKALTENLYADSNTQIDFSDEAQATSFVASEISLPTKYESTHLVLDIKSGGSRGDLELVSSKSEKLNGSELALGNGFNNTVEEDNFATEEGDSPTKQLSFPQIATPEVQDFAIENETQAREKFIASIKSNFETRDILVSKNTLLQSKLAEYLRRKRTDETLVSGAEKSLGDLDLRYETSMFDVDAMRVEYARIELTNRNTLDETKLRLQEKKGDINERTDVLCKLIRKYAEESMLSRTGKPLSEGSIVSLETTKFKKNAEVILVRLEHIKLRNKLRRHEALLRQKEDLADGLHLIDFEQLKIENQSCNEKIEERNEVKNCIDV